MEKVKESDRRILFLIRNYYAENGIMPTYRIIQEMAAYASVNSAYKLVKRLIQAGYIKKLGNRLAPDNLYYDQ